MDGSMSPGPEIPPPRPSERVDEACDRFEAAWRSGPKPRIEDYLAQAEDVDRAALLGELVALEQELRRRRGERVDLREYRVRFPEHRERVDRACAESSFVPSGSQKPGDPSGPPQGLQPDPSSDPCRMPSAGSGVVASQPHPGSHLGPYQLLELLGEGGMGRVYKARHRWLKRVVALKVIREEIVADADAIRRFRREVEAAGRLSHPNIILALDADAADGKHFLVMEYVDGLDLSRAVRERGPLPVPVACDCIRQAALGLRHVHEHALVHRDIKPANLLMTQGSVVKVADLGLARLHESGRSTRTLTQEGSLIGTPDYLAPEQAATPHRADIRADIYSLGCTFYYLLAGRPPFPGGSYLQKLVRHQECEPEPIERHRADVPPAVCRIVRKMMAKRPEDRYQAPDQVVEAVGSYCYDAGPDRERQDEPGSGPPDILLERGEPTSSRASSRRGSGALIRVVGPWIVCLGGSMVAGLLLLSGPERTPAPSGPGIRRNRPIPNQGASLPTPEYSSGFLPRDRSGDRFPPPRGRAGSSRMGEGAQDRAVAADLPRTFADGRHSRFTGRAGPREFAGTGLAKDRAPLQTDVLTVTLKAASLDFLLVSLGSPSMRTPPLFAVGLTLAALSNSGARAQEKDATADVRKMVEKEQYYKLSGPAGPRYFVVGTDVALVHARLQGDALTITLKVEKGHRGIGLLNLDGLAELEFTPHGGKAGDWIKVRDDDQTVNFDHPGILVVRIQDVNSLKSPVEPKPSPKERTGLSSPGVRAQERDATADVRKMIADGQYYKLSGPAGPRYFVVGTDVALVHARLQGDALTITLKVEKGHRGIGLLNLDGLAELEFTPHGGKADLIKVRDDDQKVNFDRPGILTVRIRDVKSLKEPIKSKD